MSTAITFTPALSAPQGTGTTVNELGLEEPALDTPMPAPESIKIIVGVVGAARPKISVHVEQRGSVSSTRTHPGFRRSASAGAAHRPCRSTLSAWVGRRGDR